MSRTADLVLPDPIFSIGEDGQSFSSVYHFEGDDETLERLNFSLLNREAVNFRGYNVIVAELSVKAVGYLPGVYTVYAGGIMI